MDKKELVLAENQSAFTDTLFQPIGGRTADGFVLRRGKRFVDVWISGKEFRVNRWLVLCERGDNGHWYHGVLSIPFTLEAMRSAFEKLSVGSEWQGSDLAHRFI